MKKDNSKQCLGLIPHSTNVGWYTLTTRIEDLLSDDAIVLPDGIGSYEVVPYLRSKYDVGLRPHESHIHDKNGGLIQIEAVPTILLNSKTIAASARSEPIKFTPTNIRLDQTNNLKRYFDVALGICKNQPGFVITKLNGKVNSIINSGCYDNFSNKGLDDGFILRYDPEISEQLAQASSARKKKRDQTRELNRHVDGSKVSRVICEIQNVLNDMIGLRIVATSRYRDGQVVNLSKAVDLLEKLKPPTKIRKSLLQKIVNRVEYFYDGKTTPDGNVAPQPVWSDFAKSVQAVKKTDESTKLFQKTIKRIERIASGQGHKLKLQ